MHKEKYCQHMSITFMLTLFYENFSPTRLVGCSVTFESLEFCDHNK